jgi:tetratricopeptide (TPR) repeat protein
MVASGRSSDRLGAGPLFVAALLAGILATGAWLWWNGRADRHLAQAERLLERGDYDELEGWLSLPESVAATRDRALLLRARAALSSGRPSQAVAPLDQIKPGGEYAGEAAFWKGRTLYAVGQTLRASAWFAEACALRPDDPETQRWTAAAAYDLGARSQAIAALTRLVELRPDDARAWRTLAFINHENALHEKALKAYESTLRLSANQPTVRLEFAETLIALGRAEEAERQLDRCQGLVPESVRCELLARCRLSRGDRQGFVRLVASALAQFPDDPGLLMHQSQVDLMTEHIDRALTHLDQAVAGEPYNSKLYYRRSTVLRLLGRTAASNADVARANEINDGLAEMARLNNEADSRPDDPEVRYRIGVICTRLGKKELAASWFRAALACDPLHAGAQAALQAGGMPQRAARGSDNDRGSSKVSPLTRY